MTKKELINGINEQEYLEELNIIDKRIEETYRQVYAYSNPKLIMLYYDIGVYINKHKTWGSEYVKRLSQDLKHRKGMSYENLYRMAKLSNEFTYEEIMSQAATQIPWFTLVTIMSKCSTKESRLWYIQKTYKNSWSRSSLIKQIKAKAYERGKIEPIVSKGLENYDNPLIKELIKDTYSLNISSNDFNNEEELKDKIIEDIIEFLKELGKGFALVGKEYKLKTKSKTYYLDLLFYNYLLHAFFVIEVKIGEYKVEYLVQLKNYVMIVDSTLKDEISKSTIGILLCRDADELIVRTTISEELTPIVLSKYNLLDDMKRFLK